MKDEFLKFVDKTQEEIFEILKTSESGLNEEEAQKRLKEYGPNKVKYFKIDLLEIAKRNLLNYFNILLFIAGILALIINGFSIETILIFIFFFIASFLSIYQDYKSNKLAEELLSYFKIYAKVKRDNEFKIIDSEKLTIGDYVRVEAGYLIPADIRIIKSENALVDESILTGESEPVIKNENLCQAESIYDAKNIGFSGTTVVSGYIEGIVIAIGQMTYLGKIAKSTLEISKETGYQKTFNKFAKYITLYAAFLIILLFVFNFLKPEPIPLKELILFAITLAISIIPEFLPGVTVLTLSISALKLAKRGLVIKRLSSIEDLGGIEILCTDKTGTITKNEMVLKEIISEDIDNLLKYGLIDCWQLGEKDFYIDAIKEKFDEKLNKFKIENKDLKIIEVFPFDPKERVKKIKIEEGREVKILIKGAPENIISYIDDENLKEKHLQEFKKYSQMGHRTLSFGLLEKNTFKYLGLAIFEDPLKETTKETIEKAKKINLKIKILTGDAKEVAEKVAIDLGLCEKGEVILGEDLDKMSKEELLKVCEKYNVFARVLPEHKFKIISALQEKYFVGYLGEGINDALALKTSDVSIVVDTATDITKEEADVILREKDLSLIVDAIYEGRKAVFNIGKYLKHTMSDNFGNFFSVAFLSLILKYTPLTPVQVLLTNLLTDLPLAFIAYDNVKNKDIKKSIEISSFEFIMLLVLLGMVAAFINIGAYLLVKDYSIDIVRTTIFLITTLTGIFVMFSIRTKDWIIFAPKMPFIVLLSLIVSIFLTFMFILHSFFMRIFSFKFLPIGIIYKLLILLTIFFILTELAKKLYYKIFPDSL